MSLSNFTEIIELYPSDYEFYQDFALVLEKLNNIQRADSELLIFLTN